MAIMITFIKPNLNSRIIIIMALMITPPELLLLMIKYKSTVIITHIQIL